MDLSKIPEPSEDDLQFASIAGSVGMLVHEYEQTLAVLQESQEQELTVIILAAEALLQKIRVIAHLLRHGRVLAKSAKEAIWDNYTPDERAAISFFEKFGGEA